MPDVSWGELMVIAVVALVVIGPKDLPQVLRTVGQWIRKVRGFAQEFTGALEAHLRAEEIEDLRRQIQQLRDPELDAQIERTMAETRQRIRPAAPVPTSVDDWAGSPAKASPDDFLAEDGTEVGWVEVEAEHDRIEAEGGLNGATHAPEAGAALPPGFDAPVFDAHGDTGASDSDIPEWADPFGTDSGDSADAAGPRGPAHAAAGQPDSAGKSETARSGGES